MDSVNERLAKVEQQLKTNVPVGELTVSRLLESSTLLSDLYRRTQALEKRAQAQKQAVAATAFPPAGGLVAPAPWTQADVQPFDGIVVVNNRWQTSKRCRAGFQVVTSFIEPNWVGGETVSVIIRSMTSGAVAAMNLAMTDPPFAVPDQWFGYGECYIELEPTDTYQLWYTHNSVAGTLPAAAVVVRAAMISLLP